jgi:hypothetical protein
MRQRALLLFHTALIAASAWVGASQAAEPVPAAPAASGAPAPPAVTPAPAAPPAPADAASAAVPAAAPAASTPEAATLDARIQDAKRDVIQLNRDLLVLEEELLFPASTQVAVFLSLDVGKLFALDSVQIKLDDKVVANHLYTPLELAALQRGGVQRVFLGNLRVGEHELVAAFTGVGPHERDYKRAATVKFDKGTEAKYIELRIEDATAKLQPEFTVKVWQ